jgi:hypothetical protein
VPERRSNGDPEDRFEDLARSRPRAADGELAPEASAAERLAELDEAGPPEEKPPGPPPSARPGSRYAWVVGVAFVIVIVVVGFNSLPNAGRGFRGPPVGEPLPAFAAPTVDGPDKVANVKQGGGDTDAANRTAACDVRERDVITVCADRTRRPLVLVFIVPGPPRCEQQVDRVDRLRGDFRGVDFVAVVSGRSRGKVRELVRRRGWRLPVAVDRDLAVFNLYRVGFCPTTVAADRHGIVRDDEVKKLLGEPQLRRVVRTAERGGG